jgi:hypothetical protein
LFITVTVVVGDRYWEQEDGGNSPSTKVLVTREFRLYVEKNNLITVANRAILHSQLDAAVEFMNHAMEVE